MYPNNASRATAGVAHRPSKLEVLSEFYRKVVKSKAFFFHTETVLVKIVNEILSLECAEGRGELTSDIWIAGAEMGFN